MKKFKSKLGKVLMFTVIIIPVVVTTILSVTLRRIADFFEDVEESTDKWISRFVKFMRSKFNPD